MDIKKETTITDFKIIRSSLDRNLVMTFIVVIHIVLLAAALYFAFVIVMGIGDAIKMLWLGKWSEGSGDLWEIIIGSVILFYFIRATREMAKKCITFWPWL
jgi:hypothetical protein